MSLDARLARRPQFEVSEARLDQPTKFGIRHCGSAIVVVVRAPSRYPRELLGRISLPSRLLAGHPTRPSLSSRRSTFGEFLMAPASPREYAQPDWMDTAGE